MRACAAAILGLMVLAGCAIEGEQGFLGKFGESYGRFAGRVEDDVLTLAAFTNDFRDARATWPVSIEELERFLESHQKDLPVLRLEDLRFYPQADGGLAIVGFYDGPGFDDSLDVPGGSSTLVPAVIVMDTHGNPKLILEPEDLDIYRWGNAVTVPPAYPKYP
jgi:hypothetical protein